MNEEHEAEQSMDVKRTQYRLRSAFFYIKLKEYRTLTFSTILANLITSAHLYNWDERAQWGINEDAFDYVAQQHNLHAIQVFCHPRLLREYPYLIGYYRNVAAIPQKGVKALIGFDPSRHETDTDNTLVLSETRAIQLAQLFNEHISLIIDASVNTLTEGEVHGMLFASTGAQIDGSWRNAIGAEAEKVIQRLLIKEGVERNLVSGFLLKQGSGIEMLDATQKEKQLNNITRYRGMVLTNQTSIVFAQDPDVSLLDKSGRTVGVIEVKGGLDQAGALERYGAVMKSFEAARIDNPTVATLLVESIITTEVAARLAQNSFIEHYLVGDILDASASQYEKFMTRVFSLVVAT